MPSKRASARKTKQPKRERRERRQALSPKRRTLGGADPDRRAALEQAVDQTLALVEFGRLEQARSRLDWLAGEFGERAQIHYGFGCLAVFDGDNAEAIRRFRRATELDPDWEEAHHNLATALKEGGHLVEMMEAFRAVIRVGPAGSPLVHEARKILAVLAESVMGSDGVDLETYVEGDRRFQSGVERMRGADWDGAIEAFQQTLALMPRHHQSYGNLGLCYSLKGMRDEALRCLDKAIELDPTYEPAHLHRRVIELLADGERPKLNPEVLRYSQDYAARGRSLIGEMVAGLARPYPS